MKMLIALSFLLSASAFGAVSDRDKAEIGAPKVFNSNPGFESGIAGWGLCHVSMSGTTPTGSITSGASSFNSFTSSASSPLSGSASLVITSSGATTAGHGFCSNTFTIDAAYSTSSPRVQTVSGVYSVTSGASNINFSGTSSNTWAVWIYDVTNSQWIQPAGSYDFTGRGDFKATFQPNITSSQYRLVFLNINASGGAISMKWDDVADSWQKSPTGPAMSDWAACTPTTNNITVGNGTITGQCRRVGANLEMMIYFTFGSTSSFGGTIEFGPPSGFSIAASASTNGMSLGSAYVYHGAAAQYSGNVYALNSTYMVAVGPPAGYWNATNPITFATNDQLSLHASVPITGWSSNSAQSSDTDTREVSANYTTTAGQSNSGGATTIINFGTQTYDTHAAVTTGASWKYTAQVTGKYKVSALVTTQSTAWTSGNALELYLYKNGSLYEVLGAKRIDATVTNSDYVGGSQDVLLSAGDYIDVRLFTSTTTSLLTSAGYNSISISRISGPAVVSATDSVNARYTNTAGTTLTKSAENTIPFATKDYDSHGAFVTDTYTAPAPGKYKYFCQVGIATGATWASGDDIVMKVYKTGSLHAFNQAFIFFGATSVSPSSSISDTLNMIQGDTLQCRVVPNKASAGNVTMDTSAGYNYFTIERVGN